MRLTKKASPPAPPSAGPPPAPPPPPPPPGVKPPRKPILTAPRWWYLVDRRLVALVLAFLIGGSAVAAFAAFKPDPVRPVAVPTSSASPAGAKGKFIAKADRACSAAASKIKGLTYPDSHAEAVAYVASATAINRALVRDLRKLSAPKADRRLLKRVLKNFDRAVDAADGYGRALSSGDPGAIAAAERRVAQLTVRANGLARAYGFGACAEGA